MCKYMFKFFPKSKVSINNNKINPGLLDQRPLLPWLEVQINSKKVGGPKSISKTRQQTPWLLCEKLALSICAVYFKI